MKISRRSFIKTSALVGAAVPALGANISLLDKKKKVITATHWAVSEATIKNGVLVSHKPVDRDTHPSIMEKSLISRTYNQTRVEYPYVREGFLKNRHKSDTTKRGKEKFIRVSWDEVNKILFEELNRVKKTHGDRALYAGSYGWYGVGKLNSPRTLLKRMLNVTGNQFVDSLSNYSNAAVNVIAPYAIGTNCYHKHTSLALIAKHTDNLILLGCDLLKTNQLDWASTMHAAYPEFEKIQQASKKGKMKVINIDPYETDTAKYLGAETIKIVPNTDVALMLGIAYYLYANNLHDKKFLEKYTIGFNQFKDYLIGKEDGVKKTPAWASRKTGISKTKIEELAKLMVSGTTMLMPGWSMQRAHHGEQPNWMIFTLASMLGQIGKNGGGFGSSNVYNNSGSDVQNGVSVPSITTKGAGVVSSNGKAAEDSIPVARISDMLLNPGKTIDYNGKKITYRDIKMIWWAGGNPMHHHQDRNTMIKAWQKPEVIVNQDPFWTATSRMADIVLPATTEIERDDITNVGSTSRYGIAAIKKGIEPLSESKNDYDIFKDLCAMYGKEKDFTEGRTQKDWAKYFYEKSLMQAKVKKIDMPTFDEFWEKGIVYFDKQTNNTDTYNAFEEFISDPLENPLGTPSGKIEIFSKKIDSFKYDDCKGHPSWFEPAEYLGNNTKAYSFHLVSPHPKFRLHSQLDNTIMREVYSVNGREPVVINPKNAKEKGIKDGDVVMLSSPRGKVLAGAVVSSDVRENVLYMQEGGWYDPLEPGEVGSLCVHGDVNVLTLDISTSKLAQGNIANTSLVNIEKFTGKVPSVKVFSKPNLG